MSEHRADELVQARRFLLSAPGPAVTNEVEALRLLAQIEGEADERLTLALEGTSPAPDEFAGYRRRRAYVWARLAQLRPEFEQTAADAVRRWQEADVIRAAVEEAAR
ncbi:MAG: hypothetical protein JO362_22090 [Streptomycetaceae bacterium]|nr:hypothetical protein [Streptomycetaceae bacterium]MBV9380673.1 hypothetical protein [Streptosporangiaceae bacterium]